VHRPVGEQLEDRGSHVTAPAASAATRSAAAASAGSTGSEAAGPEAAGTEAEATTAAEAGTGAEAGTESRAEASVFAAMFAYVVAEVATGLPALFVQDAAVAGAEPETGATRERAVSVFFIEWGVHVCCPLRRETPNALPIC
jgi:hypothetical protein